jgi:hypothetical protein
MYKQIDFLFFNLILKQFNMNKTPVKIEQKHAGSQGNIKNPDDSEDTDGFEDSEDSDYLTHDFDEFSFIDDDGEPTLHLYLPNVKPYKYDFYIKYLKARHDTKSIQLFRFSRDGFQKGRKLLSDENFKEYSMDFDQLLSTKYYILAKFFCDMICKVDPDGPDHMEYKYLIDRF